MPRGFFYSEDLLVQERGSTRRARGWLNEETGLAVRQEARGHWYVMHAGTGLAIARLNRKEWAFAMLRDIESFDVDWSKITPKNSAEGVPDELQAFVRFTNSPCLSRGNHLCLRKWREMKTAVTRGKG